MAAQGKKVAALENMPVLLPEARAYWDAYNTLAERRLWRTEGNRRIPDYIPLSEIEAFCRFTGRFDQDDQRDFLHYCSVLDREHRDYMRKKPLPPAKSGRSRK